MTLSEYFRLAQRTSEAKSLRDAMTHAALGVASELLEYRQAHTETNKIEELGDLLWYCGEGLRWDGFERVSANGTTLESCVEKFVSEVKRDLFYRDNPTFYVAKALLRGLLRFVLSEECIKNHLYPSDIMEANIRKLETRYPNMFFDKDHALNRNLDAETEALEGE